MYLPDMAVDDVWEQKRQGGGVRVVYVMVTGVDGTICMTIPGLLLFSQLMITGLHGC